MCLSKGRVRKMEKENICLSVCFVTKAIHMELVMDTSTPTFIAALKRTVVECPVMIVQIELCLNSQPMYPMSRDPNDQQALSPGHFLILPLYGGYGYQLEPLPGERAEEEQIFCFNK
ncbi:hypothetical protein LAZ67_X000485 [Cordylochernes scorpioides]|uniref:Uncharacterized protein n=1 Tax=Cordylochernes scorpioides TaxID=51811 RepID=A0ABY6LRL5_9ARAC|nr:hypothetical protein LAZ67_X000485 [Cordylochernes scorpioides]